MQYNDSSIRFVADNWAGILKECVEHKVFPTVIFYEKLYDKEEDAEYTSSADFNAATKDLGDLISLARRIEKEEKQNTEFSAADIEEQFRIQERIQGHKPNIIEVPVKDSNPNAPSKAKYMVYWSDGSRGEVGCKVMPYKTLEQAEEKFSRVKMDLRINLKVETGVLLVNNGEILDKYGQDKSVLKKLTSIMK